MEEVEELEAEAEAAVVGDARRRLGEGGGDEWGESGRARLLAFPSLIARGMRELLGALPASVPCFMMGWLVGEIGRWGGDVCF